MARKVEASIRKKHAELTDQYYPIEREVKDLLGTACDQNGWVFQDRVKSIESFALKVLDGRYKDYGLDDFYACTVVVPNLTNIEAALNLIRSTFRIDAEKPGDEIRTRPTEFSFDSIRFYCRLPSSLKPSVYQDLPFEIQVKTLLEHAWSKATHQFSYKSADVSWAKERLSAQIKAILNNVDLSILEMDKLSESGVLNKKNPRYERLRSILEFLNSEFGLDNDKRLAEHIDNLFRRIGVSIEQVKSCLEKESKEGRGRNLKNLSTYSIILLSLFNQLPKTVIKAFKRDKKKYSSNIVIPAEVLSASEIDTTGFKDVNILSG